jgi:hypothetical protein
MYKYAHKRSDDVVFYFDFSGNKYVASGGNLAWRINNPGLVHSHSHFASKFGAIGNFGPFAIFSNPQDGRQALAAWIRSMKYFGGPLKVLAGYYESHSQNSFATQLVALSGIPLERKLHSLSAHELDHLLVCIEKLCGYTASNDGFFALLPKIIAKIEKNKGQEDIYLIEGNVILSKKEAIEWVESYRLDGVIVHERTGGIHLRSRPRHIIQHIHTHESSLVPLEGTVDTIARVVGEAESGQCIWAFINGIDNTKEEALEAANRISNAAGGERVLSMPNDTICKIVDFLECCVMKTSLDAPVTFRAVKFLRYLFALEGEEKKPIILFVHSQGGIILEHALELIDPAERQRIRIFTFGGGSFIEQGKSHPDSHNYASSADFICRFASPNQQLLALERYYGTKKGYTLSQIAEQLAWKDAWQHLDLPNPQLMQEYAKQRTQHYENEFAKMQNLTILDPDPGSKFKHKFSSDCYQEVVKAIVKNTREVRNRWLCNQSRIGRKFKEKQSGLL